MEPKNRFYWMAGAVLAAALAGVVYVTRDFITTILLSFFLAYVLHPVHTRLFSLTGRRRISAVLSISVVFLIFLLFVLSVINALATEVMNLSLTQESIDETVRRFSDQTAGDFFDRIRALAEERAPEAVAPYISRALDLSQEKMGSILEAPTSLLAPEIVPRIAGIVTGLADWITNNLPILLAQFGVAILLTYYLLVDGAGSVEEFLRLMPEKAMVRRFLSELNSIYNSLFNVYLINSLLTGLIASFGYLLIGVPYPFLWGMVTALFALLPLIGTSAVFVPMALYYLVWSHDYVRAAALLAFGTVFLNLFPENIMRPALAKAGASIHPAVTLLAFAAPIFVIGVMGVIVGPALYGFVLAAYRTRLSILEEGAGVAVAAARRTWPQQPAPGTGERIRSLGRRAKDLFSRGSKGRR